jgi:hypothetical protein
MQKNTDERYAEKLSVQVFYDSSSRVFTYFKLNDSAIVLRYCFLQPMESI